MKYMAFINLFLLFNVVSNLESRIVEFHWCLYQLQNFWYCDIPRPHELEIIHAATRAEVCEAMNEVRAVADWVDIKQTQIINHLHDTLSKAKWMNAA